MPYLTAVAHHTDEDVWKLEIGIRSTWREPAIFDVDEVLWQVDTDLPASVPADDEQLTRALTLAGFHLQRGWERPFRRDPVSGTHRPWLRQAHVKRTTAPSSGARDPRTMPDPIAVSLL